MEACRSPWPGVFHVAVPPGNGWRVNSCDSRPATRSGATKAGTAVAKAPDGILPAAKETGPECWAEMTALDCWAETRALQKRAAQHWAALKSCSAADDTEANWSGARDLAAGSESAGA